MINLTTRTTYGIPAVLEVARQQGCGLVQLGTIAKRKGIPPKYLEQIFAALSRAGLVRAVRGLHGGYELAKPASEITVWDVLQVFERKAAKSESSHPQQGVLAELCRQAESKLAAIFSISLTELLGREEQDSAPMYFV